VIETQRFDNGLSIVKLWEFECVVSVGECEFRSSFLRCAGRKSEAGAAQRMPMREGLRQARYYFSATSNMLLPVATSIVRHSVLREFVPEQSEIKHSL
jgi:hypothetical protein